MNSWKLAQDLWREPKGVASQIEGRQDTRLKAGKCLWQWDCSEHKLWLLSTSFNFVKTRLGIWLSLREFCFQGICWAWDRDEGTIELSDTIGNPSTNFFEYHAYEGWDLLGDMYAWSHTHNLKTFLPSGNFYLDKTRFTSIICNTLRKVRIEGAHDQKLHYLEHLGLSTWVQNSPDTWWVWNSARLDHALHQCPES